MYKSLYFGNALEICNTISCYDYQGWSIGRPCMPWRPLLALAVRVQQRCCIFRLTR